MSSTTRRPREAGIECPECGGKMAVLDSRPSDHNRLRRRRLCAQCGWRVTTFEIIEEDIPSLSRWNLHRLLSISSRADQFSADLAELTLILRSHTGDAPLDPTLSETPQCPL